MAQDISDLVIVGGGLNGSLLALAAAQSGLSATVVDRAPIGAVQADGRAYSISYSSAQLFHALGLWDDLESHAQPMLDIRVSEGRVGQGAAPFVMHFDHHELEEGPMGYLIEAKDLTPVLDKAVAALGRIEWIAEAEAVAQDVTPAGIALTLSNGERREARVLVGCDGRASKVADRAGIKRISWAYSQTGIVATIAHDLPHKGAAHQLFTATGILAVLPLTGNRSSIVWSEENTRATDLIGLDDAMFTAVLQEQVGGYLGQISLEGARFSYPLGLQLARDFVADHVALVGDAAHGIHPLAGQGLNLGFRDIATLVEILIEARRRGEPINSATVLKRYEAWRRPDALTMAAATDSLHRIYQKQNPLISSARNLGMGIVNAVPGLRRGFMRNAAGLSGELPKLLAGKPI